MSGFEKPNYTQAPNVFFDRVLKEIDSMSELKVTLAVIRHTMGFHRDEHELSLNYLVEYTGLRRQAVIEGLKRAMKRGTVSRRESGNTFAYFMKVVGNTDQSTSGGGVKYRPVGGVKNTPKKESKKESVEANASSEMPKTALSQSVGLEKYIVDSIYTAMLENETPLDAEEFGFHLGRAKTMLEKMDPTDEEIEALPQAFVDTWTIKGRADAKIALMELRRQKARTNLISESKREAQGPAPWEPSNPHSPRKSNLSEDELARRRAEREEMGRKMAEARARDEASMKEQGHE